MLATRILIEKTLAAFRDGSRPPATAQDGRDVMEIIAACYHSAAAGHRVDITARGAGELATVAMGAPPA
jgi:predicted dehydrogenase